MAKKVAADEAKTTAATGKKTETPTAKPKPTAPKVEEKKTAPEIKEEESVVNEKKAPVEQPQKDVEPAKLTKATETKPMMKMAKAQPVSNVDTMLAYEHEYENIKDRDRATVAKFFARYCHFIMKNASPEVVMSGAGFFGKYGKKFGFLNRCVELNTSIRGNDVILVQFVTQALRAIANGTRVNEFNVEVLRNSLAIFPNYQKFCDIVAHHLAQ